MSTDDFSSPNHSGANAEPKPELTWAELRRLKQTRAKERRRQQVGTLCRRLIGVMVVALGAAAGLLIHDIAVGIPWKQSLRQFPAILLGGPALGAVMATVFLWTMARAELSQSIRDQLHRRGTSASIIPSSPWKFLRFIFLFGPPAAWVLNADFSGLEATWPGFFCILTGSLLSTVCFWAASMIFGEGRVLD